MLKITSDSDNSKDCDRPEGYQTLNTRSSSVTRSDESALESWFFLKSYSYCYWYTALTTDNNTALVFGELYFTAQVPCYAIHHRTDVRMEFSFLSTLTGNGLCHNKSKAKSKWNIRNTTRPSQLSQKSNYDCFCITHFIRRVNYVKAPTTASVSDLAWFSSLSSKHLCICRLHSDMHIYIFCCILHLSVSWA